MTNIFMRYLRRKTDPLELLMKLGSNLGRMKTLVHVGAHLAQERYDYEAAGFEHMLWIEGSPSTHAKLFALIEEQNAVNTRKNVAARHRTFCGLMSDTDGDELTLKAYSNDGMSSSLFAATEVMKSRWPDVRETGDGETCTTVRLDTLMASQDVIDTIDLLIVDVQGAELMVLKGAEKSLSSAKAVICEISSEPYYQGGVLYPELAGFLKQHDFYPQSMPRRHGDMLFLKRL